MRRTETLELYSETIAWAGENCDVETLDVTATEYEYDGIPDELADRLPRASTSRTRDRNSTRCSPSRSTTG